MTGEQRQYLDDTLSDLDKLPLTPVHKARILRDEARKLNDAISDEELEAYLAEKSLLKKP